MSSLVSWDGKDNQIALLTELQKDSVFELAKFCSHRQLPDFPEKDEEVGDRVPTSESSDKPIINTARQFYQWYASVEGDVIDDGEDDAVSEFLDHIDRQRETCESIESEVTSALDYLSQLSTQYEEVSNKTNALHNACEDLLEEQTKLVQRADCLDGALSYFNQYERISAKLSSPMLSIAPDTFLPILRQLDECMDFIAKHPGFSEAKEYDVKFRACLAKALGFLQRKAMHFINTAADTVTEQKATATGHEDNTFTMLYGKFRTFGAKVKPFMDLLDERRDRGEEYQQCLHDCQQCYVDRRETLVRPSVEAEIVQLTRSHQRDQCALVRRGCAFMARLCEDEAGLYAQFFPVASWQTPGVDSAVAVSATGGEETRHRQTGDPRHRQASSHSSVGTSVTVDEDAVSGPVNGMLQRLCSVLYDHFRPLIIHVNHLETLSELCGILKVEMIEEHVMGSAVDMSVFESMCRNILADVQERLVFRAFIYMRSQILGFQPSSGDVAYPEKLEMMMEIAENLRASGVGAEPFHYPTRSDSSTALTAGESDDVSSDVGQTAGGQTPEQEQEQVEEHVEEQPAPRPVPVPVPPAASGSGAHGNTQPLSPADLHGMWYPTVRRTLVCLSKLFRCLDTTSFQGLAQECLSLCVQSLLTASQKISERHAGDPVDAHLFLIKHLLIIREQVAPFQVEFSVKETSLDFSRLRDAAYGIVSGARNLSVSSVSAGLVSWDRARSNALLHYLVESGTPHVVQSVRDSRQEVDTQLRLTCQAFILHCTRALCGLVQDFLTKVDRINEINTDAAATASPSPGGGNPRRAISLRDQPFASVDALTQLATTFQRQLRANANPGGNSGNKLPAGSTGSSGSAVGPAGLSRRLRLYLANPETEHILFRPVRANVRAAAQRVHELLTAYSAEERQIISWPLPDQVNLLLQPPQSSV